MTEAADTIQADQEIITVVEDLKDEVVIAMANETKRANEAVQEADDEKVEVAAAVAVAAAGAVVVTVQEKDAHHPHLRPTHPLRHLRQLHQSHQKALKNRAKFV